MTQGDPGRTRGGKAVFGAAVGILMLEARFPRIPGDMGNALTWPFPVHYRVVRGALDRGAARFGFRLIEFSVQSNHLHLLCEARDRRALARGLQGLLIRIARGLNRLLGRRGRVFAVEGEALAVAALTLHLAWILWVIFGAQITRGRPWLGRFHILSLIYSIVIEVAVMPCPLTRLEQWSQARAGISSYEGDFLVHYLDKVIYPDIPYTLLVPAAVVVCAFNLGVYVRRWSAGPVSRPV